MKTLYIGWDVGGWNCDNNRKSRDGLCALAGALTELSVVGTPWRGAIRRQLLDADSPAFLLSLLGVEERFDQYVLAIDTPLGWPNAVQRLLQLNLVQPNDQILPDVPDDHGRNPFLFRHTERVLNGLGIAALSSVRDQIGSQATKGQAFLKKFGFVRNHPRPGTWNSPSWRCLEAYPAPCYYSTLEGNWAEPLRRTPVFLTATHAGAWGNVTSDLSDALMCAVVAAVFDQDPALLRQPAPDDVTCVNSEGWIWIPAAIDVEALKRDRRGGEEEAAT